MAFGKCRWLCTLTAAFSLACSAGTNSKPDGSSGAAGSGGSDSASSGGTTSDGSGGTASGGTSGSFVACPSDAYFCTGFEEAGIPAGATYYPTHLQATWSSFMKMQTAVVMNGSQALEVTGTDGYMYNLLTAPVSSSTFWARFFLRSTVDIGQAEHNSYVAGMTGNGDANAGDNMEISEQYCQMVLNLHDAVTTTIGGSASCGTGVPPLTKDEWHCIEVFFDGPGGKVQVFADASPVIDASSLTTLDYKTFGFGYLGFHGPARTLWYDDLAVGPTRPGCPTN